MFINARIRAKGVNPEEYHADQKERGDPNFSMSPSNLKNFLHCPHRWKAGYEPPGGRSRDFGALLDCLALTPEQFAKRYILRPVTYPAAPKRKGDEPEMKPWNNRADYCKDWNIAMAQKGLIVISPDDKDEADEALRSLLGDDILNGWHKCCDTQVWVEGMWKDDTTGLFIPVRCLIDYVPRIDTEYASCLGDMKTATQGALHSFQRQVYNMGYHIQAAFNLNLYNSATAEERNKWCFIGQENYPPYQPFRRMLAEQFIEIGWQRVQAGLKDYAVCLKTNVWRGYDDTEDAAQGWNVIVPSPWMEYESLSEEMADTVNRGLMSDAPALD